MIGCDCDVCRSDDPRDKRTRTSVFVQYGRQHILVDTSPELRVQCIANNIARVDRVLFTLPSEDREKTLPLLDKLAGT